MQPIIDLLKEFDEINNSFGDPDADMDKLMERQAKVQDKLDAAGAWDLDSKLEMAMDALRCPPGDTPMSAFSPAARSAAWRCAVCCCRRRTSFCSTSRRTISTPSRWSGWSSICSSTRARSSP